MYKIILFVSAIIATTNAGLLPATSYASSPALGAPLLGSVTYNAPETTVVKQPITIDQPEVHYRHVPTLVQPAVTYHHAAPVATPVVHAPVVHAPVAAVHSVAAPVAYHAAPYHYNAFGYSTFSL